MKLNALGRLKFERLAEELKQKFEDPLTIDNDFRIVLLEKIRDLFANGGLPVLNRHLEFNETSNVVASQFNEVQVDVAKYLKEYQGYIYELGIMINEVLQEIVSTSNDIDKKKEDVLSLVKQIEDAVINSSGSKSIHDEMLVTVDFRDKIYTSKDSTVDVSQYGAITLPYIEETNRSPSNITFKVEFPYDAVDAMSITTNEVTGVSDNKLFVKGHYAGKFFGLMDALNDIRMESNIRDIVNSLVDKPWEVEYVTSAAGDKLRVSLLVTFSANVSLNTILMTSSNEVEAYYKDDTGEYIHIYDYFNEWYSLIKTNTIKYIIYGDTPMEIGYNILSLVKNDSVVHTYSYLETLFRKRPDIYDDHMKEYVVEPSSGIEISSGLSDQKLLEKKKYRTAIMVQSLQHRFRRYTTEGVYVTNEIKAGNPIRSIELYIASYVPSSDAELLKYEISFDSKTWYAIKTLSDSITKFNAWYPSRILLGESGSNEDYLYLPDLTYSTFYVKVTMKTLLDDISPVVYSLKARIKY